MYVKYNLATNKHDINPPRSFSQLPTDCLVSILDRLPSQASLAVATTCRDLHVSATPFAYRDVSLDWSTRPLCRLLKLLRLIFQNPELTSYIQHVSLVSTSESKDWQDTQPDIDWEAESENFRDVIDRSMDIVRRAGLNLGIWSLPIRGGNIYCYAAIFISQLPNLKKLDLDYSLVWWDGFPGLMLKQALLSPSGVLSTFEYLEAVDCGGNVPIAEDEDEDPDSYPPYNPDQFMAWFCLPSLRYLNIWLRDIEGLEETVPNLELNKLETLILARTTISDQDVHFLLSRTPNLKTLHLGMAYSWGAEDAIEDPVTLSEALKSVSQTLEHLSLGVEYYPSNLGDRYWGMSGDHIKESFHDILHYFPKLQSAELPLLVLLGWYWRRKTELGPLLPKTLRHLCLREDLRSLGDFEWEQDEVNDLIHQFLRNWRAYTPELQTITWRLWDQNYMDGWEDLQDELRRACADAGLTLNLIVDDLGTGLWSREPDSLEDTTLGE
ncbi:hypothetical protein APSETT444_006490 [Aspergillus pseudonomiae]